MIRKQRAKLKIKFLKHSHLSKNPEKFIENIKKQSGKLIESFIIISFLKKLVI